MMTVNEEKKNLIKNINEMKNGSIEQMCLITWYSLNSYFKALFSFGRSNKVTRDNLNIIKEMFNIIRTERTLLNYILHNVDNFDVYAAQDVVGMLDYVNDSTILYYYDVINSIEDAAELKEEYRGRRPSNEFPTLIDDNSYASEVIALGSNITDLKTFLGFEDDFWNFISDKTQTIDSSIEVMEKMIGVIPIYNAEKVVTNLKVLLPRVYNLESSLLAIKVYKKAYDIYKMIGKKFEVFPSSEFEKLQDTYKKVYLPRKAKDILGFKNVK